LNICSIKNRFHPVRLASLLSSGGKVGLLFLLFCLALSAQEGSKSEPITLNLTDASLKNTLEMLLKNQGRNLLLDADVADVQLNMSLVNIAPSDAFSAILQANNLAFEVLDGNIYFVAGQAKIGTRMIVRHFACKYAIATELETLLKSMAISEAGALFADKRTNTLIVRETPETMHKIETLVAALDKPIRQVYIQSEIVEISITDDQEMGMEWLLNKSDYSRVGTDMGLQPKITQDGDPARENTSFPFPAGTGLGVGILKNGLSGVMHVLRDMNNVNLLSRPRIVAMDNQESTIEVGDQIPFKVLNQFGVTSFEFKDATVQLVVKPHIIDSNYVSMKVSPKADFQNGFTPDGTPIISTRRASTTVKIRNGQTIVIGGLIRDSIIENVKKVPLLGDIPIIGYLFKSSRTSKLKTELIVFITPYILDDEMSTSGHFSKEFEIRETAKKKIRNEKGQ